MKVIICLFVAIVCNIRQSDATGAEIVKHARSQIGVPYSWGGGGYKGKSVGIQQGAHTVGFDCSGLTQYAVYHGAGNKIIARVASGQYTDSHCHHVKWGEHMEGDLVFFNEGGSIGHVGILSGNDKLIHAPHTGVNVQESPLWTQGRMDQVQRCF